VVIKAHGIANPQWTPLAGSAPEWMKVGFRLFELLAARVDVYEVFPSASYTLLQWDPSTRVQMSFEGFRPGPKDMLDSVVAAATVREFDVGRGASVGGGDGLGEIVLPRPLPHPIAGVLRWPGGSGRRKRAARPAR